MLDAVFWRSIAVALFDNLLCEAAPSESGMKNIEDVKGLKEDVETQYRQTNNVTKK